MARKTRRKTRAPQRKRSRKRSRRATEAIEAVRRGPLAPDVPIDPDAVGLLDADAIEVIEETQELADERTGDGIVGPAGIDRARGTVLTGGDVDAAWVEADVGEETVGGSTPTPDQDIVDDLGRAAGVTYADSEPLRPEDKIVERDEKRWEVDPASAEDYAERVREERTGRRPRKRR